MDSLVKSIVMKCWTSKLHPAQFSMECARRLNNSLLHRVPDVLLTNSVIGTRINELLIDYLQQLVSTKAVRFLSVVGTIEKLEGASLGKPRTLLSLLEFIKKNSSLFGIDVNQDSTSQTCLITKHIIWLQNLICQCLRKLADSDKSGGIAILSSIVFCCCDIIELILADRSVNVLVCLIKQTTHSEVFHSLEEITLQLKSICNLGVVKSKFETLCSKVDEVLPQCERLGSLTELTQLQPKTFFDCSSSCTIGSLVSLYAIINPLAGNDEIINYLKFYKQIQRLNWNTVIKEMIMCGFSDIINGDKETHTYMVSFLYVRMPALLSKLKATGVISSTLSEEVVKSLLSHQTLLDKTEFTLSNSECLAQLVKQLNSFELVSPNLVITVSTSRKNTRPRRIEPPTGPGLLDRIIKCFEQTSALLVVMAKVGGSPDILHHGQALLNSLSSACESDEHLEILLVSCAHSSRIHQLTEHLVRLNQLSMNSANNDMAMKLGDFSLLILIKMSLLFGAEKISGLVPDSWTQNTFFSKVIDSLSFRQSKVPSSEMGQTINSVLSKIKQKSHLTGSFSYISLVQALPFVYYELTKALCVRGLTISDIQSLISEMAATSHTFQILSYIHLALEARNASPHLRTVILDVMKVLSTPAPSQMYQNRDKIYTALCSQIVIYSGLRSDPNDDLSGVETLQHHLMSVLDPMLEYGVISTRHFVKLRSLTKLVDKAWLLQQLITVLFKCTYVEETGKTVALFHIILHLVLPATARYLLTNTIPDLLQKTMKPALLAEPRCQSVCQLIFWTVASHLVHVNGRESGLEDPIDMMYKLMELVMTNTTNNQAVYLLQVIISNIVELDLPYSQLLLQQAPISVLASILPSEPRLTRILSSRKDLTAEDINLISNYLVTRSHSLQAYPES